MSIPTTTILSSSDLPSSTSTSSQPEETFGPGAVATPKIPTTTSLLFGFLVSFLGLFIVFVAWGLASRYMMDRRRERVALESEGMDAGAQKSGKPAFWDVWAAPGYETWKDMLPLSVELRNTSTSPPPPPLGQSHVGSITPAEHLLHMYHGFGRRGFSFVSPSRRTQPHDLPQGPRSPKGEDPLELRIAVLIAMPSSTSRARNDTYATNAKRTSLEVQEHRQDTMSEVAVGLTAIPWDKERMDFG